MVGVGEVNSKVLLTVVGEVFVNINKMLLTVVGETIGVMVIILGANTYNYNGHDIFL